MVKLLEPKFSLGWVIGAIVALILIFVVAMPAAGYVSKFISDMVSKISGGKIVLPIIGK